MTAAEISINGHRAPLDGHQIMTLAGGRTAGPWVGMVQRALIDAVLDGEIPPEDGEKAMAWLQARPSLLTD